MDVWEAIKSRRSVRMFRQEAISKESLLELVEAARCAPSAANRQPLEFVIADSEERYSGQIRHRFCRNAGLF